MSLTKEKKMSWNIFIEIHFNLIIKFRQSHQYSKHKP